jgi:hypothetical protein
MSSIFGAKEAFLASTRLLDTPPADKPKEGFRTLEWIVDRLFPARALNFETVRSEVGPNRR